LSALLSDEDYEAIEQAAYEAAVIPELWPKVLARVGEISNSVGGAFVVLNERGTDIVCVPEMENARRRIIDEGFMARSGRAQGVISKGLVGAPRFLNEYDYYSSPEDAHSDPIVTEIFQKEGMGWAAGWLLQVPHGDTIIMNVEQYYDRGPIVGDALARLDSVYSIFARSLTLAARAGFERVRTAIETLTAVGLPAAALTPKSQVVLANDAFGAASHVWTTRGGDRLGLHDPVADRLLTDALAVIELAQSPRSIPVRAEAGGAITAVVQVVPVRRQAHDVFGSTAAVVILSEPKAQTADATLIHSLFDLTPAEIAVAQAIAMSQTPADIARSTGRSIATVRNQLRSAMLKTGSSRQVELVLLMRQLQVRPG
jgi:DNA-binding CsgD family transcriptional regulator